MSDITGNTLKEHNLSHLEREESFEISLQKLRDKVVSRGDLPYVSVEKQLELIDQLTQFDLGKFLIERGGLNGFWIHYAHVHPVNGRITGLNNRGEPFTSLESFILDRAPVGLAAQEKYTIFKNEIQKRVREGGSFASIPCGLMVDLLELEYPHLSNFQLYGFDLDQEALKQARERAEKSGLISHCTFFCEDAWDLAQEDSFDLITSNGLIIYEPDDNKVTLLYQKFYRALKEGGVLITSFLTPPPIPGTPTEWHMDKIDAQDAGLQKILFSDILDSKWQAYRSEEQVRDQLLKAGFTHIAVVYDKAHIYPTIIAKKQTTKIKAIIFDCDGTLVDSEYSHYLAWKKTLENKGQAPTLEEYHSHVGMSDKDSAKAYAEQYHCSWEEILKEKHEHYHQLQVVGLPAISFTVDFVHHLAREKERFNFKMGVASAAKKRRDPDELETLKYRGLF